MRRFEGRVAVVTGAASGIGRATAQLLATRGCDLAITDIDEAGLKETAESIREAGRKVSQHVVDVADRALMQALPEQVLSEHGRINILINNAGVAVQSTIEDADLDNFEWIVGINFWGVVYGCRFFIPHLRKEDEAHIVNLSSMFGLIGLPTTGAYCATKAAVRSLSETLLMELGDSNIGVTSVHPGGIATQIAASSRSEVPGGKEEMIEVFARYGMPPERAAQKIVGAIERNRSRLLICRETYITDWLKRLMPSTTNALVGWGWRRSEARRAKLEA